MAGATNLPYNRDVLKWARDYRRLGFADAARAIGVRPQQVEAWEAGEAKPTVRQARGLAAYYERPFLEFFSSNVPDIKRPELVPDFRMHRQTDHPHSSNIDLLSLQTWAETRRLNTLDLYEILGESAPKVPDSLYCTVNENEEEAADRARSICDFDVFSITEGVSVSKRPDLVKAFRSRLENIGVLTLRSSKLTKIGARGLCVFADPLPVIVIGRESPGAQMFTIAHELAHVALKQSGVSGKPQPSKGAGNSSTVEDWCDRFAAAFLMPSSAINSLVRKPAEPAGEIDNDTIASLALRFSVSRHAMTIRLVELGYVDSGFYWNIKRGEFLQEEADYKSFGRPPYYGTRYRNAAGDLYTGLVLEAWSTGRISNHNAGEFLDIKNPTHLFEIRDHFGR